MPFMSQIVSFKCALQRPCIWFCQFLILTNSSWLSHLLLYNLKVEISVEVIPKLAIFYLQFKKAFNGIYVLQIFSLKNATQSWNGGTTCEFANFTFVRISVVSPTGCFTALE